MDGLIDEWIGWMDEMDGLMIGWIGLGGWDKSIDGWINGCMD